MWEYKCDVIHCEADELISKMNALGKQGWEIFSLQTKYGELVKWNRYELAMKRKIREGQI
jgi:hypothetical protein